jgi:hypothetical protein
LRLALGYIFMSWPHPIKALPKMKRLPKFTGNDKRQGITVDSCQNLH